MANKGRHRSVNQPYLADVTSSCHVVDRQENSFQCSVQHNNQGSAVRTLTSVRMPKKLHDSNSPY